MTSFTSSDKTDARPGGARRRRRWIASLSGAHLLIVVTGVLALVTNLVLLRRGEEPLTRMAVSAVDLAQGRVLQGGDTHLTPLDVSEDVASGLISEAELNEYQGWLITEQIAAGSLLTKASLRSPLATVGFRAMSFPVDADHAAGGNLVPGDLVDVIRVDTEQASFVATAVEVLGVSTQSEGALGLSGGSFHLVLEVDDRTALALALALAHAEVEVLRSTGSAPVEIWFLNEPSATLDTPATPGGFIGSDPEPYPGPEDYEPSVEEPLR
ncbi:MAG: RcpC/CpaB family pilus assembly protein [bacterium]|nr:RcpC/CpaB family pilus assembly protein [bacterium]MDE0602717.1 RcpC/CpaB family pilus assembly protein [bacterium]